MVVDQGGSFPKVLVDSKLQGSGRRAWRFLKRSASPVPKRAMMSEIMADRFESDAGGMH